MPDSQITIPLSIPFLNGNEWKYVKECIDTEWVSSAGEFVDLFEQRITDYTGAKYAIACVNGTSALQVSLRLVGVEAGDEVIVPTLTFIAPINAVSYNGASPIFMDSDKYYNLDHEKTIQFINKETIFKDGYTYNKKTKKRISAILPVHVWGNASWLDELIPLCQERNIAIVEDASESLGTFYNDGHNSGKHAGKLGKIGCLSFNGNKIITTGGGGMILTDDPNISEKAKYLTTQAKDDPLRYVHDQIGYNFRLTNIQAALGVAQLEQLPEFLKRKNKIYRKYVEEVKEVDGLQMASVPTYANNNHWMNVLQIEGNICGREREMIMKNLKHEGVQTRPVWCPNHLQKPYRNCQAYQIERAGELIEKSLCLPSSIHLGEQEIRDIAAIIEKSYTLKSLTK